MMRDPLSLDTEAQFFDAFDFEKLELEENVNYHK